VPLERLAWDAHGNGLDTYHAWLIQKTEQGCNVIMGETQHGWLNRLENALRHKSIQQQQQIWLEGLRAKSSSGLPPTP